MLTWTQDTAPPDTTASITSPTSHVDVLDADVINSSADIALAVTSTEVVSAYVVVVDGTKNGLTSSQTLQFPVLPAMNHTLLMPSLSQVCLSCL